MTAPARSLSRGFAPLIAELELRQPTLVTLEELAQLALENVAEKIARLTRRTPARDVYDLVWIATTSPHSGFHRDAVRRLAVRGGERLGEQRISTRTASAC